ncbi:MAG: cation:proton antiporter [Bryobacterales bacterium]|nr:cation:proton antiporter [Bryobacterales bacterium]
MLLFMLGLEYTGDELKSNLRRGLLGGGVDLILNFLPGFVAGLVLGWTLMGAVLLGGVTYISSSGIVARVLAELGRLTSPETRAVLSVLVLEDMAMAVYLPLVGVLVVGGGLARIVISESVALVVVAVVLFVAKRYGKNLSRLAAHESDEIVLLTVLGTVLLVSGFAQHFQVSAAIAAFLVGIAISGPLAENHSASFRHFETSTRLHSFSFSDYKSIRLLCLECFPKRLLWVRSPL